MCVYSRCVSQCSCVHAPTPPIPRTPSGLVCPSRYKHFQLRHTALIQRVGGSPWCRSSLLFLTVAPGNAKAAEAASSAFYNPSNPHGVYMPTVRHMLSSVLTQSRFCGVVFMFVPPCSSGSTSSVLSTRISKQEEQLKHVFMMSSECVCWIQTHFYISINKTQISLLFNN